MNERIKANSKVRAVCLKRIFGHVLLGIENRQAFIQCQVKMSLLINQEIQKISLNSSKKTSIFEESEMRSHLVEGSQQLKISNKQKEAQPCLIRFNYKGGHAHTLINRDLRLQNTSSTNFLYFKIKASNPKHYKVHPSEAEIPPERTIELNLQLIIDSDFTEEVDAKDLQKFNCDKFKIMWGVLRKGESKPPANPNFYKSSNYKIYKTFINLQHTEAKKETEDNEKTSQAKELVHDTLDDYKRQLSTLDALINQKQMEKTDQSAITCACTITLSVVSFCLGLLVSF